MSENLLLQLISSQGLFNTVILGLGIWIIRWYIPRLLNQREDQVQYQRSRTADSEEHNQKTQSDASKQVLEINQTLIKHLIEANMERGEKMDKSLKSLNHLLGKVETAVDIMTRDWSRLEEILSDIDIMMTKIQESLKSITQRLDSE